MMICGTFTRIKIPQNEVAGVVNLFKATVPPPTNVTQTQAADGTWTVVATWPPCPPNTTHSTGTAADTAHTTGAARTAPTGARRK
jgi:hypothetical protein